MNPENASNSKKSALVSDLEKSRAALKNINWNFYDKSVFSPHEMRPFKCSAYHWCPATFIPEIPFTLIEVLTSRNAVVYDPFGGIGTTYFQALLLNRKPVTNDICKINVEFIRSLFVLLNPATDMNMLRGNIKTIISCFDKDKDYTAVEHGHIQMSELRPWYSLKTFNELSFLFAEYSNCADPLTKAAMWISISSIMETVSSQQRGWGCIADNVLPKPEQMKDHEVISLFATRLNRLLTDVTSQLQMVLPGYFEAYVELSTRETVFYKDTRECTEVGNDSVDLVVTSPPYPNMTDYVKSRRLSYYLLGINLTSDLKMEIGARSRRQTKDSLEKYSSDMNRANEVIAGKIKKGGYACYIMPVFDTDNDNNTNRKRVVQKVISKLEDYNLVKEEEFERILPKIRRGHNLKWATLERERIYLFRKV